MALLAVSLSTFAGARASEQAVEPVSDEVLDSWYADLGPKAIEMWPNEYGAIWYRTPGDPQGGLDIGFTEYAQSKVDYLAQDFPRPDLLHATTVPISNIEMENRIEQVANDAKALDRGEAPFDGKVTQGYDIMDDLRTGEVVLQMANPTERVNRIIDDAYSFPVSLEEGGVGRLAACNSRSDCGDQLRAGLQSRRTYDPSIKRCSTGFTVIKGGNVYMLSAAHCTDPNDDPNPAPGRQPGELRYHGQGAGPFAYGKVTQLEFGDGVDVELIAHSINPFTFRPQIYAADDDKSKPVSYQGNYPAIYIGQPLCRAGNTTGRRCGDVVNLHYRPQSYNYQYTDFVRFTACSAGGDSGGPVFYGEKAWGIYAGYVPGNDGQGSCSGNGTHSFFGPINRDLAAVGATLAFSQ